MKNNSSYIVKVKLKIAMKHFLTLIIFFNFGCNSNSSTKLKSLNHKPINESLILNIAFSDPDLDNRYLFTDKGYDWAKKKIFSNPKVVYDSILDITMCLYKWTYDGGQSFPNYIIYINNNKDFEYAFSFRDELYYFLINNEQNAPEEVISYFKNRMNFENQLNLITNQLKINRKQKSKELNHFLQFFTDSLMGMKEITGKDTLELRHSLQNEISYQGNDKICIDTMKYNVNKIISSINNQSKEKYYTTCQAGNAFWTFAIKDFQDFEKKDSLLYIESIFLNKECYKLWFY